MRAVPMLLELIGVLLENTLTLFADDVVAHAEALVEDERWFRDPLPTVLMGFNLPSEMKASAPTRR